MATLGIVVALQSNFPGNIYQSYTPYSLCTQFFKAKNVEVRNKEKKKKKGSIKK